MGGILLKGYTMRVYRNEIHEMTDEELMELLDENNIVTALEIGEVDADDVIDLIEAEHGVIYESAEDDILDSIYNGNWSQAAEQMLEVHITPSGLVDYISDYRFEQYEEAYEFFDLSSAVCITQLYETQRRVV